MWLSETIKLNEKSDNNIVCIVIIYVFINQLYILIATKNG